MWFAVQLLILIVLQVRDNRAAELSISSLVVSGMSVGLLGRSEPFWFAYGAMQLRVASVSAVVT